MNSVSQLNRKASLWAVGLMLFALFFGAGNLIFPAYLGQQAGESWFSAMTGFLLTGAGLPLLGVIAIGYSGSRDVQALASRVAPWYGVAFAVALYLSIGPLFAMPRSVSAKKSPPTSTVHCRFTTSGWVGCCPQPSALF